MDTKETFITKKETLENLTKKPSNDELLKMYGLVKQAEIGDINRKKPGMFDMVGQFKWKAWKKNEGMSTEDAMQEFIAFADEMIEKYGLKE